MEGLSMSGVVKLFIMDDRWLPEWYKPLQNQALDGYKPLPNHALDGYSHLPNYALEECCGTAVF